MQVLLTTDRAGISWFQAAGEVVDVPPAEAERLVAAGQAERITNQAGADSSNPADISYPHKQRNRRR